MVLTHRIATLIASSLNLHHAILQVNVQSWVDQRSIDFGNWLSDSGLDAEDIQLNPDSNSSWSAFPYHLNEVKSVMVPIPFPMKRETTMKLVERATAFYKAYYIAPIISQAQAYVGSGGFDLVDLVGGETNCALCAGDGYQSKHGSVY